MDDLRRRIEEFLEDYESQEELDPIQRTGEIFKKIFKTI